MPFLGSSFFPFSLDEMSAMADTFFPFYEKMNADCLFPAPFEVSPFFFFSSYREGYN